MTIASSAAQDSARRLLVGRGVRSRCSLPSADVRSIQESLADFICSLCKQKYRDHWNADHFFEYAEDLSILNR